jgi:hypothetical protein
MEGLFDMSEPQGSAHPRVRPGLFGEWLTTEELAAILKRDASTLRRWRTSRPLQGPPFVRMSDRVTLYSAADVEAWLSSCRVDPRSAA